MLYSRLLYHICLCADSQERTLHPISKGVLLSYLQHVCCLLGCNLVKTVMSAGRIESLVEINPNMPIDEFICRLKDYTSEWIHVKESTTAERIHHPCYWTPEHYCSSISPEDKAACIGQLESMGNEGDGAILKHHYEAQVSEKELLSAKSFYHIILITSRSRLLLPIKYRLLLYEMIKHEVQSLGADLVGTSAMRNHVHMLSTLPPTVSLSCFVSKLKSNLLERMRGNRHFSKMEDWSDDSIAYTVSVHRLLQEEHDVLNQDMIHWRSQPVNEMSHLYQKMNIPYITSLH